MRERGQADVVIANNVLAHVENLHEFVAGIGALLKPGGSARIEVHYLKSLIDGLQFDTIYHEHLCYFSAGAIARLLTFHDLHIHDIERIPAQGGSLRLTASRGQVECTELDRLTAGERRCGLTQSNYHDKFAVRVGRLIDELKNLVAGLKADGSRIAAYGAAAKGTMLLNACGFGTDVIDYVVDANPHKQGRLVPGVHLPVMPVNTISESSPDFMLLLPWNLKEEILAQQAQYREAGGKFIVPIPMPEII